MRPNTVVIIAGAYYKIRSCDSGFQHPEDKGLWRAGLVEWERRLCYWNPVDDYDYMISDDGRIMARESGWNLQREDLVSNE